MTDRVDAAGLQIDKPLFDLVTDSILSGTGIDAGDFWRSLAQIVRDLGPKKPCPAAAPRRAAGPDRRLACRTQRPAPRPPGIQRVLHQTSRPVPRPAFTITTEQVDPEIATIAGPQLVVPVNIARYALNAANARWGTLYDALYGTDVIPDEDGAEKGRDYTHARRQGDRLCRRLPRPGRAARHRQPQRRHRLRHSRRHPHGDPGGRHRDPSCRARQARGLPGDAAAPSLVLLRNNGLHIEIQIDRDHPIGRQIRPASRTWYSSPR